MKKLFIAALFVFLNISFQAGQGFPIELSPSFIGYIFLFLWANELLFLPRPGDKMIASAQKLKKMALIAGFVNICQYMVPFSALVLPFDVSILIILICIVDIIMVFFSWTIVLEIMPELKKEQLIASYTDKNYNLLIIFLIVRFLSFFYTFFGGLFPISGITTLQGLLDFTIGVIFIHNIGKAVLKVPPRD